MFVCFKLQKSPPWKLKSTSKSDKPQNRSLGGDFAHVEYHCLRSSTETKILPIFFSRANGNAIFLECVALSCSSEVKFRYISVISSVFL